MMEVLSLAATSLVSIIVSLGGGILFYHSRSRKERADATKGEYSAESIAIANMRESAVEWKQLYESKDQAHHELMEVNRELNRKIDTLYREKSNDRDRIFKCQKNISELQLEMALKRCEIKKCLMREPQNGY